MTVPHQGRVGPLGTGENPMARRNSSGKAAAFMMFNVTYEDGLVTSNRRVPSEQLDESYGDSLQDLARTAIESQDNEIAQRSGQRRAKIKSIVKI